MAMRDFAAVKMAMRDYGADMKLIISSTLQQLGVKEEYEKLQSIVNSARRHVWESDHTDERYSERAKELFYEAEDKLDELSYEAMRIFHQMEKETQVNCMITTLTRKRKVSISSLLVRPCQLLYRLRMSRKIKDLQHVLNNLELRIDPGFAHQKEKEIYKPLMLEDDKLKLEDNFRVTYDIIGRVMEKVEIVNMLVHANNQQMISVIPIVGMAGVGKTVLVSQIYLHWMVGSHFDLTIWVEVTEEFSLKEVVAQIIENCTDSRITGWDNAQQCLEENLSGKRFLLVLDNASNQDKEKWVNMVRMLRVGSRGSAIIVTTRSHEVASMVATVPPYNLNGLSADASWKLFSGRAFMGGRAVESEDLVKVGKEIVKRCRGLPLALKSVADALRWKPNKESWEAASNALNPGDGEGDSPEILVSVQKICYHSLPSPFLKRCFAYCLVFPENFTIEKKSLIQQWMAQGFLKEEEEEKEAVAAAAASSSSTSSSGEDIGDSYSVLLVGYSLLLVGKFDDQENPLDFRMPELSHKLARTLLGNDAILSNLDDFDVKRNNRRTYLHSPTVNIPFFKFRSLRVLELRHFSKDELPSSIGELVHLRYLDLSYGTFKALPASISKLYHLQTLKLLHCRHLQRLPKEMRKLINLRYLENERTLRNIPRGLIGNLRNLRTFNFFHVGNTTVTDDEAGIEELQFLKRLGGSFSLLGLGNVKNKTDAIAANLKEKTGLEELMLEWESDWHVCTNNQDREKQGIIFEELQPPENLQLLTILRFKGTKLPAWLGNGSSHLANLQELRIYACHHVKSLDLTGLSSLWKLTISYCENLEYAGIKDLMHLIILEFNRCGKLKSLLGVKNGVVNQEEPNLEEQVRSSRDELVCSIPELCSLRKLQIKSCDHLTTLKEEEMSLLRSLRTLCIGNCKNLMILTKGLENLSRLESLQIENCPNIKELPEGVGHLSSLEHFAIRDCPKLRFLSEEIRHWTSLQTFSIFGCTNLRCLPKGIDNFMKLKELEISGSDFLHSFPNGMQVMKSLQKLKIGSCSRLEVLPASLSNLLSLLVLEISSCNILTSLPGGMQDLIKIDTLKITGCENLIELPEELGNPSTLRVLTICGCPGLEFLPEGLGNHQNLSLLAITDCSNLKSLPRGLRELSLLQSLYIQKCFNLTLLPDCLQKMTSLRVLWLIECHRLKDFPDGLRSLSALEKLTIWGCHELIQPLPQGIENLKSLEELTISNCSKLESLPEGLENLPSLKELVIWKCPKLKYSKSKIQKLIWRKLRKLNIRDCPYLETIDDQFDPDYIFSS